MQPYRPWLILFIYYKIKKIEEKIMILIGLKLLGFIFMASTAIAIVTYFISLINKNKNAYSLSKTCSILAGILFFVLLVLGRLTGYI